MKKKVLVCDDEDDIRDVLEMLIEIEFDVQFFHARDGLEAIEILSKEKNLDLVICDMNMPNSKGIDVYNYNKKHSNLPFILLSADCEQDRQSFADFCEENRCFTVRKPWEDNEFIDCVRPFL